MLRLPSRDYRGDQATVVCNECGKIVRSVPASDLRRVLDQMEARLDVATAKCPRCGTIHVAPGFTKLSAFICDRCGESVTE